MTTFAAPTKPGAALSDWVRPVPDWPKPGIMFRDLTPLWADGGAWARCVAALAKPFDAAPPELVLGIEARGFVVAAALAARWGAGILLARKPGKLPGVALREDYQLEYGTAALEIHTDAVQAGERVLVVDDVLATGGTAKAAASLVERVGGKVCGIATLIELEFLHGRDKLQGYDLFTLIKY